MSDSDIAIRVHKLHKSFDLAENRVDSFKQLFVNVGRRNKKKRQVVLDGISFEVKKGDFFGIVGRNGSGKSTLLKILAGVYTPNAGAVEINGQLTPFIELGVGFNPELTGRDNVYLSSSLLGFNHRQVDKMYDDIVEFAELKDSMGKKLKNYSSGMQVRLAFSIAVRARSDILLLDEVLAVGDAAFQQKCYNHFEELKSQKKTVVFVSHDMGAIRRFCTRALYIENGRIKYDGSPSDIADVYAEANIGQEEVVRAIPSLSNKHSVDARISAQDIDSITLEVIYKMPKNERSFIGISVVKDGVSIAAITTSLDKPLTGSGRVLYVLDKKMFNAGIYYIGGVSLFRSENRELLTVAKTKNEFVVKNIDETKGGALKLPDTWIYETN